MIRHRPALLALILVAACGGATARADHPESARSVAGRWTLVSISINGVDRTGRGGAATAAAVYYTFSPDGRFRITQGDSVRETGAWSEDTTKSPAFFDHIPDVDGKPGPYVTGISRIDGDTLTISIVAPNAEHRHPTLFHSSAADSSWLLVYRRATP